MNVKFLAVVAALTGVSIFGLFCLTVRTFPEGGIRIDGPWNIRIEASLGGKPAQTVPSLK